MKKYRYVTIAAIAVLLFTCKSCSKENYEAPITDKALVNSMCINNGRMVFKDYGQMRATMNELYSMDDSMFKNWEKSTGFTSYSTYRQNIINENYDNYMSMGENAPVKEYNKYVMPDWGLVANQNMEYQVGDSIYFIVDNKIYGVPYEGEEMFKELKSQISNNSLKSDEQNFLVSEIKIDTLKPNATTLKTTGLDARYQKQWNTNGVDFKFVFESYKAVVLGGTTVYVVSKLEYWHHRTWPFKSYWDQAGETIYKSFSNLQIRDYLGVPHVKNTGMSTWGGFTNQNIGIQSLDGFFGCGAYVRISGTIYSYTTCFITNKSYGVTSDYLWDAELWGCSLP